MVSELIPTQFLDLTFLILLILLTLILQIVKFVLGYYPNERILNFVNSVELWVWMILIIHSCIFFFVPHLLSLSLANNNQQLPLFLLLGYPVLHVLHYLNRLSSPGVKTIIELLVAISVIMSLAYAKAETEVIFYFENNGLLANLTPDLEYDYYRLTCPQVESIVRSRMAQMYTHQNDISPALLRLFFHDCFIQVTLFSLYSFSINLIIIQIIKKAQI